LGWSLNFEMFFYMIFAATLWTRPKVAIIVITIFFVGLAIIHPLFEKSTPMSFWSLGYVVEFIVGVWLAVAAVRLRWRAPYWMFWPAVGVGLAIAAVYFRIHPVSEQGYYLTPFTFSVALFLGLAGVFIESPAIVGPIGKLIGFVGDASFSLYLTHMFTVRVGAKLLSALKVGKYVPYPLTWFLLVCVAVGIAYLSYRFLELRFISIGKGIERRRLESSMASIV
jgi:exopolysaccharide production protein ExoZ